MKRFCRAVEIAACGMHACPYIVRPRAEGTSKARRKHVGEFDRMVYFHEGMASGNDADYGPLSTDW